MINMNTLLPLMLQNRNVFYRETTSWMYDSLAYSLSNVLVEVPTLGLITLATMPVIYFMMALSPDPAVFFFHYLTTWVLASVYASIGMLVGAAAPTFEFGQMVVGIVGVSGALGGDGRCHADRSHPPPRASQPIFFLFGGLWSPPSGMVSSAAAGHDACDDASSTLPPSLLPCWQVAGARWFTWIDPILYAFRALIPIHFRCLEANQALCPTIVVPSRAGPRTVQRSSYVRDTYDVHVDDVWISLGYLAIFIAVFQLLAMLATRYIKHISR
jgi:hypothetical protein